MNNNLYKTKDIKLNSTNNIEYERFIWQTFILNKLIIIPIMCTLCGYNGINLTNNDSLANPYIGRCNNNKCRKVYYLRNKTFFALFPKTNISTIIFIIKLWIFEKKNSNDIHKYIKEESDIKNISKIKIDKILHNLRKFIAHYYKDVYCLEQISTKNAFEYFAIDESDFIRINGKILWVIGIINTINKKIRLEVSYNRNTNVIKKIIKAHIATGNIITSDGWGGYSWIDQPFSGYIHSTHNHGNGDFGTGVESTSHIEALWSFLKSLIKSIYYIIPREHFILFLRESEFRRNINSYDNDHKWEEICGVLNYIRDIDIDSLYSEEYLEEIIEN